MGAAGRPLPHRAMSWKGGNTRAVIQDLFGIHTHTVMLAATGMHVGKTTLSLGVFRGLEKKWGHGRVAYCKPLGQRYKDVLLPDGRSIKVRGRVRGVACLRAPPAFAGGQGQGSRGRFVRVLARARPHAHWRGCVPGGGPVGPRSASHGCDRTRGRPRTNAVLCPHCTETVHCEGFEPACAAGCETRCCNRAPGRWIRMLRR